MNEKEIIKYKKYLKIRNKEKVNWFDRIRYWKLLQKDYQTQRDDTINKQEQIHNTKVELSAYKIKGQVLEEELEQLKPKKRGRKKNG